jgi:hypothetical protein
MKKKSVGMNKMRLIKLQPSGVSFVASKVTFALALSGCYSQIDLFA